MRRDVVGERHYPCVLTGDVFPQSGLTQVYVGFIDGEVGGRSIEMDEHYLTYVSHEALEERTPNRTSSNYAEICIFCDDDDEWEPVIQRKKRTTSSDRWYTTTSIRGYAEEIVEELQKEIKEE